jgi:hypothetical protein
MARDESGNEDFAWSYPKSYGAYGAKDSIKKTVSYYTEFPFKGQKAKVSEFNNTIGSNFFNNFGGETYNVIGAETSVVFEPIWLADSQGLVRGVPTLYEKAHKKWGNKSPGSGLVKKAIGALITGWGLISPLLLGQGGRTELTVADETTLSYLGTVTELKRGQVEISVSLKEANKLGKATFILVVAMGYSMLALTLAIRLAWYNFDEKLANASNGSTTPKPMANTADVPASGTKSGAAAGSGENSPAQTGQNSGASGTESGTTPESEWKERWQTPKIIAQTVYPLAESRLLAIVKTLETFSYRIVQCTWYFSEGLKLDVEAARRKIELNKARLDSSQALPVVARLKLARKLAKAMSDEQKAAAQYQKMSLWLSKLSSQAGMIVTDEE